MANPIFNALGGMTSGLNPAQMLSELKANPFGVLKKYGFNVPENMNDPNSIIQHLMNSGHINQSQYNQARNMAQGFGVK